MLTETEILPHSSGLGSGNLSGVTQTEEMTDTHKKPGIQWIELALMEAFFFIRQSGVDLDGVAVWVA